VQVRFTLDGTGKASVRTGLPFLDHMLELFAVHGLFDLTLKATGDIVVDQHHTVEDIGLVLGAAIDEALGDRKGLVRYASLQLPMDECLVGVALDLGGRPYFAHDLTPKTRIVGSFDSTLVPDFFIALVQGARVNTDNNMYVEFNGPRDMVLAVGPETFSAVEGRASPVEDILTDPAVLLGSRERLERFITALRKLEKPTERYERLLSNVR